MAKSKEIWTRKKACLFDTIGSSFNSNYVSFTGNKYAVAGDANTKYCKSSGLGLLVAVYRVQTTKLTKQVF